MALIKSISGIRGTIGGIVGEALTPLDVVKFTAAYGTWIRRRGAAKKVVVGRDGRISGEMVQRLVIATLQSVGLDVVSLDLATTPTVEMAVPVEEAGGGIILSASHNPKQWNALKLLNELGEFISAADGQTILDLAEMEDFDFCEVDELGSHTNKEDYLQYHIDKILELDLVDRDAIAARGFKILVDGINSVGGFAIPALLKALGVETVFCVNEEPTGRFAHNPEPLPQNLISISNEVVRQEMDLGIIVDPDADRLCFINEDGSMFGEEYTLVAVADYILKHKPGNTVSNLSSTKALEELTKKSGNQYFASAVGEVNVVAKMKMHDAIIGGEGNGGIIYPELHYGRDALVGVALFLSHLAHFGKSCSFLRSTYPSYHLSKHKIELTPDIDVEQILGQLKEKYRNQPINTIDGVYIEFEDDWIHLRKSNTEPIIRIYAESNSEVTAQAMVRQIQEDIRSFIF